MDPIVPPGAEPIPARLTLAALTELAGVDADTVRRLIDARTLAPRDEDPPFVAGDVYRIRLILACEAAGMGADAIGKAIDAGSISLGFLDLPHYRWGGLTPTTYRELAEATEVPIDVVLDVVASMGSIGRAPDDRVRQDELEIFPLIRFAATMLDDDSLVRTARVYAQALRRITDAEAALWQNHVLGGFLQQGMSFRAVDMANAFGAEVTSVPPPVRGGRSSTPRGCARRRTGRSRSKRSARSS